MVSADVKADIKQQETKEMVYSCIFLTFIRSTCRTWNAMSNRHVFFI